MVFFSNIAGKSEVVSEEMIAPCTEATLTTILSRYPLENIFSADKFGLLYLSLSNKTLHFRGDKCSPSHRIGWQKCFRKRALHVCHLQSPKTQIF